MRGTRIGAGVAVVGLGLAAAGWCGRDALTSRYYVHKLTKVSDAEAVEWADQAGDWGAGVAGRLLDCLTIADDTTCERAQAALARLIDADAEGGAELLQRVVEGFDSYSPAGQGCALELAAGAAARVPPPGLSACRALAGRGLQHPTAAVRVRAVCLAMRPELQHLDPVAPLLADPSAEVRRAAVLALGASRTVAPDDLLRLLHDDDAEVQRLCRMALRGRGLRERDLEMGRLMVSPRPADRLRLLGLLHDDGELDLSIWLRRLSDDSCPAVRAAAARATGENQVFQLLDRLAQMAQSDPDQTVRPIAQFHLKQMQTVRPAGGVQP